MDVSDSGEFGVPLGPQAGYAEAVHISPLVASTLCFCISSLHLQALAWAVALVAHFLSRSLRAAVQSAIRDGPLAHWQDRVEALQLLLKLHVASLLMKMLQQLVTPTQRPTVIPGG